MNYGRGHSTKACDTGCLSYYISKSFGCSQFRTKNKRFRRKNDVTKLLKSKWQTTDITSLVVW